MKDCTDMEMVMALLVLSNKPGSVSGLASYAVRLLPGDISEPKCFTALQPVHPAGLHAQGIHIVSAFLMCWGALGLQVLNEHQTQMFSSSTRSCCYLIFFFPPLLILLPEKPGRTCDWLCYKLL